MMPPLTPEENLAALERVLRTWRDALAETRWNVQIHRDVLNSPAEVVTNLEAQAIKQAEAVKFLESKKAEK